MIGLLFFATVANVDVDADLNKYARCIDQAMGSPSPREMTPQELAEKAEAACRVETRNLLAFQGARSGAANRLHKATLLLAENRLSGKGDQPPSFSEVEKMIRANAPNR